VPPRYTMLSAALRRVATVAALLEGIIFFLLIELSCAQ
jgi:hypothetical protein